MEHLEPKINWVYSMKLQQISKIPVNNKDLLIEYNFSRCFL